MRGIFGGRGILGGAVLLAVGFAVLLAVGFAVLLQAVGVADAGAYLFLFLGIAFALAYIAGTQQYVYLVPGATMIGSVGAASIGNSGKYGSIGMR